MPAQSSRQNRAAAAPVFASAPFSAGPSVRVRTTRTSDSASGIAAQQSSSHGDHPERPQRRRARERAGEHRGVQRARALAPQPHRERALAGAPVGVDVAHVVDDEDRARQQPDGDRAAERLPWQRLDLDEVGADDGDDAEEQEHEQLAEALVSVGSRAARVQHAGEDRRRSDREQLRAGDGDQVGAARRPPAPKDAYVATSTWRGGTSPPAVTRTGPRRSSVSAPRRASE